MQVFGEWAQVEVVELVNDGSGLAFGIVGGRSSGVVVKSVLPGGVADRDGRLRSGDMLLRIGAVSVVGMCARQAAAVLRQCGACVRLLVARPAASGAVPALQSLGASQAPVVPSRLLADPIELERRLSEAGHDGFGALCEDTSPPSPPPTIIEERLHHRPVASIVAVVPRGALAPAPRPPPLILAPAEPQPQPMRLPLDMAVRGTGEPETLSYEVELNKDSALGLGITVAGYVCEQEELSGIFVKSISEGSSADVCGKIQVNDRIVEVDGVPLHGVTNHRAVALLRDAKGPVVRLKALRYLRGAGFEKLQRALAAQDGRRSPIAPPSPSVTSLAKYSFSVYDESTVIEAEPESEIQPHLPSPTSPSEEAEIVIGRDEETPQRKARRIQDKWRDILQNEHDWPGNQYQYEIIVGTIMKDKESGLGISLEGTVRVVAGKEVQARHYIRAIAPNGPVAKLGIYKVGDELLEVNGWRVLGSHHVELVTRLRAVVSPVTLVVVRKQNEKRPQVEPGYGRNQILGGSLQELLAPPQRLIKAKSESSLASFCSAATVMSTGHDHDEFCSESLERNRSRSLEPLSGLAMWSDRVQYIQLLKEERGLGFSILDYLDPSEPGSSVIVVRSVVAGGAAAADGRLAPGDRLVSVNGLDVSRSPLATAVTAIKSAPRGIVTIGVAKPLPCSTVVGGEKANGHSTQSSQECINSLASDDHTGMDSFHECLQEYGEGLEVVQICLEPEEASLKDEELSAFGDLSFEDCKKSDSFKSKKEGKMNGVTEIKSSKSEDSIDEQDDDMTITEDDVLNTPRELNIRSKSVDRKEEVKERCLSKQQSKDISTSDEMVFAVTPTGLERISYDKYWKECDETRVEKTVLEKVKSDESWKECLNSPTDETSSFYDTTTRISVQEENNSLLYIDHEIDGYETCLDEDSTSVKCTVKNARKTNGDHHIKESCKHDKIAVRNKDNDISAKTVNEQNTANAVDDVSSYGHPYVQEHIIKQMKSLRIEPLNINISSNKLKKRSPTKPSKTERRQCVEYYNDQAECLKEIKQRKLEEEQRRHKEEQKKILKNNLVNMEKKMQLRRQEPSEESTDLESYVPGCHKCFLENYAYEITKAYIAEANACKYCEVIRDMLEPPKTIPDRRMSAPALVVMDSGGSETDDEDFLLVPVVRDRRKSAGPLKFLVPSRRPSYVPQPAMTVTVSPDRRESLAAQRWGQPRQVTLKRSPGAPLGVSIVGGKVDIISNENGEDGDEKAIFGIFIKNVVPESPAGNSGELQTGDRILEVDGVCVRSAPHERAVQLIRAAGDVVTLTVQSLLAWNTDSSDMEALSPPISPAHSVHSTRKSPVPTLNRTPQHEIKITVTSDGDTENEKETEVETEKEESKDSTSEEQKKPVYSDSESSDEEDERELGGRTYSEKGIEIDRASAGAIKRTKEEKEADAEEEDDFGYTSNKIRKKYANLGDSVVAVKLERTQKAGLGLSLAGHRDRSRMAVFVCGLHPAGAAAKASPPVKVGDEILEVNGIVLHGRCHLNASAIIKGLVGPIFKIILLRRKSALEDCAVKPLTQFPVALEEEGCNSKKKIMRRKQNTTSDEAKGMESDPDSAESLVSDSDTKAKKILSVSLSKSKKKVKSIVTVPKKQYVEPELYLELIANPPQSISDDSTSHYPDSTSTSERTYEQDRVVKQERYARQDRTRMPSISLPLDTVSPYMGSPCIPDPQTCSEISESLPTDSEFKKPVGDLSPQAPLPTEPRTEPVVPMSIPTLLPEKAQSVIDVSCSTLATLNLPSLPRDDEPPRLLNPVSLPSDLTDPNAPLTKEPPSASKKPRFTKSYPPASVSPTASAAAQNQPKPRISSSSAASFADISDSEMADPFTPDWKSEKPIPEIATLTPATALELPSPPLLPRTPTEGKLSEDRFAGYKGVRDITIKKGPSGLGLMIIEGRHAEAGRGIFVSDLQEGSAAEQAGLQIGDMILAVNRDSLLRCSYDAAAAKLKHTEGAVKLTVCTPNLKDKKEDAPLTEETGSATTSGPAGSAASRPASGHQTPDPGLAAAGTSRPHSPRPAPSPVRTEPPADPATAPILPNQETVIEITTESQNLGMYLLGGSDTSINGPAAVVLDVIKDRPVDRDGRLQRGDQIRAACGVQLTEAMTEDRLNMTIKQWAPKLKFTVFRPDPIQYEDLEVDVNRKQKPLGFSFAAFSNDRGVYITQILPGSPTEQDGRLRRGDHILVVDGKDISSADFTTASIALKLIGPKVSLKVRRLKIVR